jgi:hypothetical protein
LRIQRNFSFLGLDFEDENRRADYLRQGEGVADQLPVGFIVPHGGRFRQIPDLELQILIGLRQSYGMPIGVLRVLMGVFCVLFSYSLGKSAIRLRRGRERRSRTVAWALRTLVTGTAASWRAGFDEITVGAFAVAILSFAGGAYLEGRPRRRDELDKVMFPPE